MRRNIVRYAMLSYVITLQKVSLRVKKRFPTWQHMVDAGEYGHCACRVHIRQCATVLVPARITGKQAETNGSYVSNKWLTLGSCLKQDPWLFRSLPSCQCDVTVRLHKVIHKACIAPLLVRS
jgi:hypothetical protein